jgi:4-hydroxybenzoate polyprenyltransferase
MRISARTKAAEVPFSTEGAPAAAPVWQVGAERARQRERSLPLVVDLDRDLLRFPVAEELALAFARRRPRALPRLMAWAVQGAVALETRICASDAVDPEDLPLEAAALEQARAAASEGRRVVLTTSAHPALANLLRRRCGCFSDVAVLPAADHLEGLARTAALARACPDGFVSLDGAVSRGAPTLLVPRTAADASAEQPPARPWRVWAKAARLHQWAKNALILVPLVLAGKAADPEAWACALAGFLAFGLVASGSYLLNDLRDLRDDRRHWSKRNRPLASGAVAIRHALLAAPIALAVGLGIALAAAGPAGVAILATYLALTLAYTFWLKQHAIIDAGALAGLFTVRLLAGIAFAAVPGSPWLLVFSMFVFGSLALAKRHIEITRMVTRGLTRTPGRGYVAADAPVVLALGAGAGMAAILIFVLYLIEEAFRRPFYVTPEWLWVAPVALFLWLGRIWLLCGRGEVDDDPVEFAVKDAPSLCLGGLAVASFVLACL